MTDHGLGRKKCTHYEISMSKDATYFFMTCKGPDVPYTCICRTDNGKLVKVYDDNKALEWRLNTVNLPTVKMMDIPASVKDHAPRVRARVYLPPDLNPNVKYPTLVKVYGGPGSQIVDETFDQFDYQTYLAGTKGFVFIMLDPQVRMWFDHFRRHSNEEEKPTYLISCRARDGKGTPGPSHSRTTSAARTSTPPSTPSSAFRGTSATLTPTEQRSGGGPMGPFSPSPSWATTSPTSFAVAPPSHQSWTGDSMTLTTPSATWACHRTVPDVLASLLWLLLRSNYPSRES